MSLDPMPNVIFRADANAEVGLGHVMRMRSLAQEFRNNGWRTHFYGDIPEWLTKILAAEGHDFVSVKVIGEGGPEAGLLDAIRTLGMRTWVVLDGYGFNESYQKKVLAEGVRVMVMDDYCHQPSYACDLIVNQNAGSEQYLYVLPRDGKSLCGTRYVLLREEFIRWGAWQRDYPEIGSRLLITAGGADPHGIALDWLDALERKVSNALDIHLLLGADNPREREIEALAYRSRHRVTITPFTADMPGLMAWADVALTAGGSTLWESAFMALPAVVVCLADNQQSGAKAVAEARAAVYLGEREKVSPDKVAAEVFKLINDRTLREALGLTGRKLVDGLGAERVRVAMEALS
jgi:UDP-2,4-diacetamido-2,4,6-trideoxy-beta-L-altropyranose hydrolase